MDTDKDQLIDQSDWTDAAFKTATELQTKDFSKMYSFGKVLTFKDKIVLELAISNKPCTKNELGKKLGNRNIYQSRRLIGGIWSRI